MARLAIPGFNGIARPAILALSLVACLVLARAAQARTQAHLPFRAFNGPLDVRWLERPSGVNIPNTDVTLHVRSIHWKHWGSRRTTGIGKAKWCVRSETCSRHGWNTFTIVATGRKLRCGSHWYTSTQMINVAGKRHRRQRFDPPTCGSA